MISAFEFPDFLKLMTNRRECLTAIKKKTFWRPALLIQIFTYLSLY